jgi:crotonobetainyl-CoA:carnitine CoA-transferase CaiB-like acyl-CoA transferase
MDDLVEDEHVARHNMLVEIPTGNGARMLMPGNPIKMSRVAEGPLRLYPTPGQDTDRVLAELLGLDGADIDKLRASGALG